MTEEKEAVEEQVQTQDQHENTQEVKTPEPPRRDENPNWNEAREVLRLQKQRIEELEAKLAQNKPQPIPETDDVMEAFKSLGIDNEDYLTAEKALKLTETIADKRAEKKSKQIIQEYIQQQNIANDEQRMRTKHEDFDYVIEHFALPMIKNDPALAYKIQQSKNPAETAYKLAKISDDYEAHKMKQQTSPKAEKILKNSSRPVSANAVNTPLTSQAEEFSKLSREQVWEMSQKFARGA